jgi:hypothetical protein
MVSVFLRKHIERLVTATDHTQQAGSLSFGQVFHRFDRQIRL